MKNIMQEYSFRKLHLVCSVAHCFDNYEGAIPFGRNFPRVSYA
jgi:hypothetical protein